MSGGRFEYRDQYLMNDLFGWDDEHIRNVFEDREITELAHDLFDLIHDLDWYLSGDTCEETYLKKKAGFKKKWFESDRKDRIKKIIDAEIEQAKKELYKTFLQTEEAQDD